MLSDNDYTALKDTVGDGGRAHPLEAGSNIHDQKGSQSTLSEEGLLATILLHRNGSGAHDVRKGEATFLAGRPAHSAVPALVWGGIHAALGHLSRRGLYWRMMYGTLYWTGYMLFLVSLVNENAHLLSIALPLMLFYTLAMCLPCLPPSSSNLQQSAELILREQVNPILAKLGYCVEYRVEPTGPLQKMDHRLYVKALSFSPSVKTNMEIATQLTVLTMTQSDMGSSSVGTVTTICLHAPFSRLMQWKLLPLASSPVFFADGPPATLRTLHPFLWGALYDSVLQVDLSDPYRAPWYFFSTVVTTGFFGYFLGYVGDMDTLWWTISFGGACVITEMFTILQTRTRLIESEVVWKEAIEYWKPIFHQAGWKLEYQRREGWMRCVLGDFVVRIQPTTSGLVVPSPSEE
mmetsp:Transcript_10903/g.20776  ORF Transcript_10903/g.20776 Transcript_10903/m.20776 type:complete len:405 (-) Transcript_10903:66-1280(-)